MSETWLSPLTHTFFFSISLSPSLLKLCSNYFSGLSPIPIASAPGQVPSWITHSNLLPCPAGPFSSLQPENPWGFFPLALGWSLEPSPLPRGGWCLQGPVCWLGSSSSPPSLSSLEAGRTCKFFPPSHRVSCYFFSSLSISLTSLSKAGVALVHPLTGSLNPGYFTAPGISVIMVVSGSRLIAGSVSL